MTKDNIVTQAEIFKQLEQIRQHGQADNEQAHILEDRLYIAVLKFIASGKCEDPARYATIALNAHAMEFTRRHA